MAINWRSWPQKGTFEVTAEVEGWALNRDNPGDPLGEARKLLPGAYTVTHELQASSITNEPDRGGVGSVGGHYYVVDPGESVVVPSRSGTFTPDE